MYTAPYGPPVGLLLSFLPYTTSRVVCTIRIIIVYTIYLYIVYIYRERERYVALYGSVDVHVGVGTMYDGNISDRSGMYSLVSCVQSRVPYCLVISPAISLSVGGESCFYALFLTGTLGWIGSLCCADACTVCRAANCRESSDGNLCVCVCTRTCDSPQ